MWWLDGRIEERVVVDHVVNDQGELLVECLLNSGLCMVNGRKGNDEFTCISSKGSSVVDYCFVPMEELDCIINFAVNTVRMRKNPLQS